MVKPDIHPEYKVGTVTCACGNSFQVRSTVGDMIVEICSACHPFFTGKQKLIDSAGRVEKFRKKYGIIDTNADEAKDVDVKTETKIETKAEEKAKTIVAETESEKIEDKEAVINS